jgi:DNA-directed RNA polymerase subunit K/omega
MSEPASKPKKVVKKSSSSKKPEPVIPQKSPAELETSSILENDYRTILASYDPSKNKSRPIISIYERTLLIGKRATQIAYGANPLITVEPGMNEVAIAEEELKQRKIPLIIKRTIGDHIEYWKPVNMIVP